MSNNYAAQAVIFKAFCDENRLRILEMLQDGEKCACKILEQLEISQSTLSHHMKILVESGLVQTRNEGKWTHYSYSTEGIRQTKEFLDQITTTKAEECYKCKC